MATITVTAKEIDNALSIIRGLSAGFRYYETTSKLTVIDEGEPREKQIQLLVAARDCTEAEKISQAELTPQCYASSVDVLITKVSKYAEAHEGEILGVPITGDSPKWYGVKVNFIIINDSGKQKKQARHYLLYAGDVRNAHFVATHLLLGTVGDYEIASISETKIEDVIHDIAN